MLSDNRFRRGDIVELKAYNGNDPKMLKQYKAILNMHADKLAVIRNINESTALVAICVHTQRKNTIAFKTNVGDIHIHTRCFYAVNTFFFDACEVYFYNSCETISRIYDFHNHWIEDCRKKRELEQSMHRRQQERERYRNALLKDIRAQEKEKRFASERRYERLYELAIMNNDKEEMKRIETIVGHPLCQSSKGYASPSCKVKIPNNSFNPKPLNGGKFSPK